MWKKIIPIGMSAGIISALLFLLSQKDDKAEPSPSGDGPPLRTTVQTAQPSNSLPATVEEDPAVPTEGPALHGLLLDSGNATVADGDILYKFIARDGRSCEVNTDLDFNLDPDTRMVRSDGRGRFDIALPDDDNAQGQCLLLNAFKEGYTGSLFILDLDLHAGVIELELDRHQTAQGKVISPAGIGMAGASVKAWVAEHAEQDSEEACAAVPATERLITAHSGDGGRFSLDLAGNDRFCLQASHPDWASSDSLQVNSGEQRDDALVLSLNTALQVSGRTVAPEGRVVPDVALQLHRPDAGDSKPLNASSGPGGEFLFRKVDTGEFVLQSGDPAFTVDGPKQVSVKPGQSLQNLVVHVSPVTRVSGRIVDDRGRPVSGVRVSTRSPYLPQHSARSGLSDDSGYFEVRSEHRAKGVRDVLKMARGISQQGEELSGPVDFSPRLCINFYHPRLRADELALSVSEPELNIGTIYMEEAALAFDGILRNHRGEPLEGKLSFTYVGPNRGAPSIPSADCGQSKPPLEVHSDSDGTFSLNLQQTGRYEVRIETRLYQDRVLAMDLNHPGERIDIKLD